MRALRRRVCVRLRLLLLAAGAGAGLWIRRRQVFTEASTAGAAAVAPRHGAGTAAGAPRHGGAPWASCSSSLFLWEPTAVADAREDGRVSWEPLSFTDVMFLAP